MGKKTFTYWPHILTVPFVQTLGKKIQSKNSSGNQKCLSYCASCCQTNSSSIEPIYSQFIYKNTKQTQSGLK